MTDPRRHRGLRAGRRGLPRAARRRRSTGLEVAGDRHGRPGRAASARGSPSARATVVPSLDAALGRDRPAGRRHAEPLPRRPRRWPRSSAAGGRGRQAAGAVSVARPSACSPRAAAVTVFQNRRWDGDFLTVRKLVDDGALGDVVRLESRFDRFRPEVEGRRVARAARRAGGRRPAARPRRAPRRPGARAARPPAARLRGGRPPPRRARRSTTTRSSRSSTRRRALAPVDERAGAGARAAPPRQRHARRASRTHGLDPQEPQLARRAAAARPRLRHRRRRDARRRRGRAARAPGARRLPGVLRRVRDWLDADGPVPVDPADASPGCASSRPRGAARRTGPWRRSRLKTSLGIWALGPMVTRFVPGGYQPEHGRRVRSRTRSRRAVEGLGDLMDGYEFHYPRRAQRGQPRRRARRARRPRHLLHGDRPARRPALRQGRADRPRRRAAARGARRSSLRAADFAGRRRRAAHLLARGRGLQLPVPDPVPRSRGPGSSTGVGELAERCHDHGIKLFLEHKNSEPAMKIFMRNIGMTLHIIHTLRARRARQRPGQHGLAAPAHERREPRRVRGAARRRGAARPPARELGLGHVRRRQHGRRHGVHGDARGRARAAPRGLRARRRPAPARHGPLPVHRGPGGGGAALGAAVAVHRRRRRRASTTPRCARRRRARTRCARTSSSTRRCGA